MKIILDYHDTLNDKYDFPDGNTLEKSFTIRNLESSKMELTSSPPYVTTNAPVLVTVAVSLTDSNSSSPLDDRKIMLVVDDVDIPLTTDIDGFASFSKMIDSQDDVIVQSFFEVNL